MTTEDELKKVIADADDAINREDFGRLMELYADDATLVVMPGRTVQGKEQIRSAMARIAEFFNHTLEVSQREMLVLEGGDTALVIARTVVNANQNTDSPYFAERKATYVFRRFPDGRWRCVIDNSYGTELLSQQR
jgi:uncharacterized protein (TIGR02246 family)